MIRLRYKITTAAKRSIAAQVRKRKSDYRKVGDKIGPKDWEDQRFS